MWGMSGMCCRVRGSGQGQGREPVGGGVVEWCVEFHLADALIPILSRQNPTVQPPQIQSLKGGLEGGWFGCGQLVAGSAPKCEREWWVWWVSWGRVGALGDCLSAAFLCAFPAQALCLFFAFFAFPSAVPPSWLDAALSW